MIRGWKRGEWLGAGVTLAALLWLFFFAHSEPPGKGSLPGEPTASREIPAGSRPPTASEALLEGYGDPDSPPVEDLRKIHRVVTGYFSVIKDPSRNPIGGNADLAAALRGENPDREAFLRPDHPVFSADGLLRDRWGSPLVIHPEGWRELEIRSAGPDRTPYTEDDLILAPTGLQPAR